MSVVVTLRAGIYIVPTDRWYIERTVWFIAGCVLLAATALAAEPPAVGGPDAAEIESLVGTITPIDPITTAAAAAQLLRGQVDVTA